MEYWPAVAATVNWQIIRILLFALDGVMVTESPVTSVNVVDVVAKVSVLAVLIT
jgi:hypothetical protein